MSKTRETFEDFARRTVGGNSRESSIRIYTNELNILQKYYELSTKRPTVEGIKTVLNKRLNFRVGKTFSKDGNRLAPGKISANTYNTTVQVLRMWVRYWDIDPTERPFKGLFKSKTRESRRVKTADELLTLEQVEKIVDYHRYPVWKAFTSVLWDTGCRPAELCSLDYDDVVRDQHGFVMNIKESKTKTRSLRLITPLGLQWFGLYFRIHSGNGALFVNGKGNRISSNDVAMIYKNVTKALGQSVWATLFRKSASTYWKRNEILDDTAIRRRLGHKQWSKTFERHYHQYFDEDYLAAELRVLGIEDIKEKTEQLRCWNCSILLHEGSEYCPNCHQSQHEKTIALRSPTDVIEELLENPESMKVLAAAVAEALAGDQKKRES